jgi:choline dehydrogenase-like flavoprotein
LYFAPQIERREKTLEAFARFVVRETGPVPEGIAAVRKLEAAFAARTIPPNLDKLIEDIVLDPGAVLRGIYRRETGRDPDPNNYIEFEGQFEQAPNPDSRVMLGDEIDQLGQRRTLLDWQFTELDHHTYRCFALTIAAAIARLGLGRMKLPAWLDPNSTELAQLGGCAHHMGTTRMSDDPSRGVVDRNCRVHGIANLYIGGSSCFPTGGCGFPTLTIVALAVRLARHLQRDLTHGA